MNIVRYAFKDIKDQKLRSILGIVGVAVSIFLLSTVSFLTDTVSATYVNFLTTDAGNIDYDIYWRDLSNDQQEDPYWINYTQMIDDIKGSSVGDEIRGYIPRSIMWYSANRSNSEFYDYFYFVALNNSYETDLGFGSFEYMTTDFSDGIPYGNCAISEDVAQSLNVNEGDVINVTQSRYYNGSIVPDSIMNLTVYSIFKPILKFPSYMDELVLIELEHLNTTMNMPGNDWWGDLEGTANHLYLTLEDAAYRYNINDIEGTKDEIMGIAEEIQLEIGYGYWINMPKLQLLEYAEYISMATSIIFILIGLISMLISGILINGILSTSVEERIREFGIFRCLGAHKAFNLKLVLVEGMIICLLGTTIGVFSSMLLVSEVAIPLLGNLIPEGIISGGLTFVARPSSFIIAYAVGIGVSMVVSISPAVKVMKMEIVQSINPYRHEENLYKLVRDQPVNYKLILFGALLAANGSFVFFLIPRMALSLQVGLLATSFIVTLLVFLIGMTMAGIGLMPLLLRLWIVVFTPAARKLMNIIKVTLFRYQRRNYSTILMFCLSFSFVIFTSSMIDITLAQSTAMEEYYSGSPLVLYRTGNNLNNPTIDLQQELLQVEGIEKTSAVIANPWQLTDIYSENGKEFDAEIGDYIYLSSSDATLYGVDENYLDTVYSQYNSFSGGNAETAFSKLHNGSNTCIISDALAESLSLDMNDEVRMNFIRGDEESFEIFTIVGIAERLAGFGRFQSAGSFFSSDGVMISSDKYVEYMGIPSPAWVYKIFIDLRYDYNNIDGAEVVKDEIDDTLGTEWTFYVDNVIRYVGYLREDFRLVEIGLQLILSFTVVICLFGLFASSYSSIIERKREIGVLRALGLRRKGVGKLFTVESIIILLAAGSTGSLVGYVTAALLSENMILFTGAPRLLTVPWMALGLLFGLSLVILYFGMKILLVRIKNKNLIEIFRETT
mgnify:CR=1 FL=1